MGIQGHSREERPRDRELTVQRFRRFFELPHHLVGVKLLTEPVDGSGKRMRYCEGVRRSALYGEELILTAKELTCGGAEVALGFSRPLFGEARLSGTEGVLISPLHKMRDAEWCSS